MADDDNVVHNEFPATLFSTPDSPSPILDSSDPYEKLGERNKTSDGNRANGNNHYDELLQDDRNGDVGALELAVEAQPDLVFESDLGFVPSDQLPFVRPRVYLERESFSNNESTASSKTLPLNTDQ